MRYCSNIWVCGSVIIHVLGWICMWTWVKTQVAKMKSPSWSRKREWGKERETETERGREFEHVWKNPFIFTPESLARPSMPIHFLELAIVSPSGTTHTLTQTHTQTHTGLACFTPLWISCNLTPTWRQSQTHTHMLSVGMTPRKWPAAAGGSLHSSTETDAPQRPPLTLS